MAYAWRPAQQTWSLYWDRLSAYTSVWKTLYPSVWSTSLSNILYLQWIYPALSCEFFSFICIYISPQSWQPASANFTRAKEGDGERTVWTWGHRITNRVGEEQEWNQATNAHMTPIAVEVDESSMSSLTDRWTDPMNLNECHLAWKLHIAIPYAGISAGILKIPDQNHLHSPTATEREGARCTQALAADLGGYGSDIPAFDCLTKSFYIRKELETEVVGKCIAKWRLGRYA